MFVSLIYEAERNNTEMVTLLINSGANVDHEDNNGQKANLGNVFYPISPRFPQ